MQGSAAVIVVVAVIRIVESLLDLVRIEALYRSGVYRVLSTVTWIAFWVALIVFVLAVAERLRVPPAQGRPGPGV